MENKQILDFYKNRYACKEFDLNKKISQEDFNIILEAGRLSPSSVGLEPWKFIIIQNFELRNKLIPLCSGGVSQLKTASHFVIILARTSENLKSYSTYVDYILKDIKDSSQEIIKKVKSFLKRTIDNSNDDFILSWALRQTYIALANMMTCATFLNINSCPIEGFNKSLVEELLFSEKILDKDNLQVSCMVAFGYEKYKNQNIKKRQPLDKITSWVL